MTNVNLRICIRVGTAMMVKGKVRKPLQGVRNKKKRLEKSFNYGQSDINKKRLTPFKVILEYNISKKPTGGSL